MKTLYIGKKRLQKNDIILKMNKGLFCSFISYAMHLNSYIIIICNGKNIFKNSIYKSDFIFIYILSAVLPYFA